jgi:Mg2+ and Co2+ transporter CorA
MDGGSSELPKKIVFFRQLVNHIKRNLLDSHTSDEKNVQNVSNLSKIVSRIRQFGNILTAILHGKHTDAEEYASVHRFFTKNHFQFDNLTPEEKELCLHYIDIDIKTYPYDLNPSHIDHIQKY